MSVSITLDARTTAASASTIQEYVEHVKQTYESGEEQGLFLPSLVCLSECFQCSAVEVYQALESLRAEGFDYYFMSFESPVTLWYPARIA